MNKRMSVDLITINEYTRVIIVVISTLHRVSNSFLWVPLKGVVNF